jgi:hypothetical protein
MLIGYGYSYPIAMLQRGGGIPLLDDFPGATGAFSLRKLRSTYTGSAVRVRRLSDNAQQDIGFVGLNLDTSALLAFAGSGSCSVVTWYNQASGSTVFLTQTADASQQPLIVASGFLYPFANGKFGIKFNGSNQRLTRSSSGINLGDNVFTSLKPSAQGKTPFRGTGGNVTFTEDNIRFILPGGIEAIYQFNPPCSNDNVYSILFDGTSSVSANAFRGTTSFTPPRPVSINLGGLIDVGTANISNPSFFYDGVISEIIVYPKTVANLYANRALIHNNIIGYYKFSSCGGGFFIPIWDEYLLRVDQDGAVPEEAASSISGCLRNRFEQLYYLID